MNVQKIEEIMSILGIERADPVIMEIIPAQAKMLLRYNTNNRRVSENIVDRYAQRMEKGQWKLSNDAITFSENGELSNGQHRLRAIVKSGKAVSMLVAFNTDNFAEMDRGKARTVSDNIQTDVRFRGTNLATNRTLHQLCTVMLRVYGYKADTEEVASLLQKYGAEMEYLDNIGMFAGPKGLNAKSIAVAFFSAYMSGVDIEKLKHIREVLTTGLSESDYDSPIIALRDRLISTVGGGASLDKMRYRLVSYTINAVDKGLIGKQCKNVDSKYTLDLDL